MSFHEDCDARDHFYTVDQSEVGYYTTGYDFCPSYPGHQSYKLDGIEGYLLDDCPKNYDCDDMLDATAPKRLHRLYSAISETYALVLEDDLTNPAWSTFSPFPSPGYDVLGYAFRNTDSDNDSIPDGWERILGTDPLVADSDCDGVDDGNEYPVFHTTQFPSDDPMTIPNTCP